MSVERADARVLIYSHDSFGLGHLRRCRTIAHALVRAFPAVSVLIVSGSPIIGRFDFGERVDFVRIPGVIKLTDGDYRSLALSQDVARTIELRAAIIRETAASFDPDIFIVDKEPLGLRGEVAETLKMLSARGTTCVLGLRDILDEPSLLEEEWRRKHVLPALESLYDEVWIYGLPQVYGTLDGIELPDSVRRKVSYTGYLRAENRPVGNPAHLPFARHPFILVTAGGGGDGEGLFDWVLRAYEIDAGLPYPALIVLGPFMHKDEQDRLLRRVERLDKVAAITFDTHLEYLMDRAEGGRIASLSGGGIVSGEPETSDADVGFGDEIDVLARIPLFAGLPRARLKLLSFASERFSYADGEDVFHQGDVGDRAYVIIEGDADVIIQTADGPRRLVTMKRGELFGELALLCEAPRSATIRAAGALSVMTISKDVFLKLVAEDVDMSARVTRAVAERLERTTRDLSAASAVRDSVSDLPDIRLFKDRLGLTIARNRRYTEGAGLLWFDAAQNFDLNGGLSKSESARLARAVADRLRASMRDTDIAARLGDLGFLLLVSPAPDERSHRQLSERIARLMAEPIDLSGATVPSLPQLNCTYRPVDESAPDDQIAKVRAGDGIALSVPTGADD